MDERVVIALLTISGAFLLAGLGFFYRGVAKFAEVLVILKAIQHELGDRESGIRGALHSHASALLRQDGRILVLEERTKVKP